MDKSICFLTRGDITWASSRMRCYWPAHYIPGAAVVHWDDRQTQIPEGYRLYVWQKTGHPAVMEQIHRDGGRNALDCCDPSWWWQPGLFRELDALADVVVCCTHNLADDYRQSLNRYGVFVVPDRLEMSAFPHQHGEHTHADPVRFVWYGVAVNRIAIMAALANLERLACAGVNLTLTIVDDAPEQPLEITNLFPVLHTRWNLAQESAIIAGHDIALVPPFPGPWGALKSNNRTLTAYACGIPATDAQDYGKLFDLATFAAERDAQAKAGAEMLHRDYHAAASAADWMRIAAEVGL